jgi:hypothetical protein
VARLLVLKSFSVDVGPAVRISSPPAASQQRTGTRTISPISIVGLPGTLAQVEGAGNPIGRTYWRWRLKRLLRIPPTAPAATVPAALPEEYFVSECVGR